MEGGSDGTSSPSAGLSSPHSLQPSPNPDSSGMLSDQNGQSPSHHSQMCSPKPNGILMSSPPRQTSPLPLTPKNYGHPSVVGLSHRHDLTAAALALSAARGGPYGPGLQGLPPGHHHSVPQRVHTASPPGVTSDGSGNECRLIDYRGAKVAAFLVNGEFLLCLPQAFELFLKHLVGGLHTVYTKLKRLDITPIVCNVEQVRILRGLGAIQPGVNRCKLLSCKDFDCLYKDCTTARPGRPPKRASMVGLGSHGVNHQQHHLLSKKGRLDGSDYAAFENGHIPSDRLDKTGHLLPNGYSHHAAAVAAAAAAAAASSPHINPLPFMALNHPGNHPGAGSLMSTGMPPISLNNNNNNGNGGNNNNNNTNGGCNNNGGSNNNNSSNNNNNNNNGSSNNSNIGSSTNNGGNGGNNGSGSTGRPMGQSISGSRPDVSVIKDRASSATHPNESLIPASSREEGMDFKDKFYGFDAHRLKDPSFLNGYFWLLAGANGHSPVLNLSQHSSRGGLTAGPGGVGGGNGANGGGDLSCSEHAYNECADDENEDSEDDDDDDRDQDLSDNPDVSSTANPERVPGGAGGLMPFPGCGGDLSAAAAFQASSSSVETLLRNIQGLLKVAADNARGQERQINLEKAELKMDILRERELRENVEKQLLEEQRVRILYQKRLRREKKCRRRLHEQLDAEMKKRAQYEDALRNSSGETLRLINESLAQEIERERERNSRPTEPEHKIQDCPMSV